MRRMSWGIWIVIVLVIVGLGLYWTKTPVQLNFNDEQPTAVYHWKDDKDVLVIATISVLNRKDTIEDQHLLTKAIGEQLHTKTMLIYRNSYEEILNLLESKKVDVAILSTGAYILHGDEAHLSLLAMQERQGKKTYNGYILVPSHSDTMTIEDLKGKDILYTDPDSYSGYLSVLLYLRERHYNPNTFFGHTSFTYSNDYSIREVAAGKVAATAVDSYAYDYLKMKEPELIKKVRILAVLPSAGTGPVVAREGLQNTDKIAEAFLTLQHNPLGAKAMKGLLIDKFVPPVPTDYPTISSILKEEK